MKNKTLWIIIGLVGLVSFLFIRQTDNIGSFAVPRLSSGSLTITSSTIALDKITQILGHTSSTGEYLRIDLHSGQMVCGLTNNSALVSAENGIAFRNLTSTTSTLGQAAFFEIRGYKGEVHCFGIETSTVSIQFSS